MMAHGLIDGTLPACQADYSRFVTRAAGTGQQRWLGDVQMSFTLLNWAHLYQRLRRRVPDDLYRKRRGRRADRSGASRHDAASCPGRFIRLRPTSCAPTGIARWDAGSLTPAPRLSTGEWCCGAGSSPSATSASMPSTAPIFLRPVYQGGHGVVYYVPGSGQGAGRGRTPSHVGLLPPGSGQRPGLGARR